MTINLTKALAGEFSVYSNQEETLENYNEFGFHVEKNVFDTAACELLIKESHGLKGAQANDFKPYMMPHRENETFLSALKNEKIAYLIGKFCGGVPAGLQTQLFYCRPGTRGFSLHQDNFFVQAKFGAFVSAWIALVDTAPQNGGLIVYPGSHKEGLLPVRKLNLNVDPNQDPNANNEESVVPEQYQATNLTIPRGAVLFIHGHVVHGSNPNKSDANRYVLLSTYIKSGETFRSGNYAQREEVALA